MRRRRVGKRGRFPTVWVSSPPTWKGSSVRPVDPPLLPCMSGWKGRVCAGLYHPRLCPLSFPHGEKSKPSRDGVQRLGSAISNQPSNPPREPVFRGQIPTIPGRDGGGAVLRGKTLTPPYLPMPPRPSSVEWVVGHLLWTHFKGTLNRSFKLLAHSNDKRRAKRNPRRDRFEAGENQEGSLKTKYPKGRSANSSPERRDKSRKKT